MGEKGIALSTSLWKKGLRPYLFSAGRDILSRRVERGERRKLLGLGSGRGEKRAFRFSGGGKK